MWTLKSICLSLAIVLGPVPGWATGSTPDPGLRYQVVDVEPGDVLNVRERPGPEAKTLGGLTPDADNVIVTGSVTEADGSQWWEIIFVDGYLTGWVNSRYLEPANTEERESEYPLACTGTEPFWSLEMGQGQASYSAPDQETVSLDAGPWRTASGQTGRFAVELERNGEVGHAAVWREDNFCSDGMSDIRYPFGTILIRPDGEVLAGCCRRSR